ncbi:MAG: STAS domain-containing protein [Pseudonocardia sp.]|uniref:STAS domain-containing protein n=1 Tax=Pseudonocardia sp. TaxID=60912 RepID=UPI001AC84F49|nr:STAS domain-containing protein [Pseudonocardia sp.]MBN9110497.1 STAS domain-containing protein [Pseudonocardia sp.]
MTPTRFPSILIPELAGAAPALAIDTGKPKLARPGPGNLADMTPHLAADPMLLPTRSAPARPANVHLVRLRGEYDALTSPDMLRAIRDGLATRPDVVAVDLSGVTFLGVAGLRVLLTMRGVAAADGTVLELVGSPPPIVARLLGLVGWSVLRSVPA